LCFNFEYWLFWLYLYHIYKYQNKKDSIVMFKDQVEKLWEQGKNENSSELPRLFFDTINIRLRERLSESEFIMNFKDYGAGTIHSSLEGRILKNTEDFQIEEVSIADLSRRISVKGAFARFLFLLVKELKPKKALELGAGFGISGALILSALRAGNTYGHLLTFEGCPYLANEAEENFSLFSKGSFDIVEGKFLDTLGSTLQVHDKIDFVFIDGHNNPEMRCQYIETILPFLNDGAIVLMRAIKWKKPEKGIDMELSWIKIQEMKEFSTLLDEKNFGVLVYNKNSS